MGGRAELLKPLSWVLFCAGCPRKESLSEYARLWLWLVGLRRLGEARREAPTCWEGDGKPDLLSWKGPLPRTEF